MLPYCARSRRSIGQELVKTQLVNYLDLVKDGKNHSKHSKYIKLDRK